MRLFVGLRPSPEFRDALAETQRRLRGAGVTGRYLDPENLHLTLAFIGMWPEAVTEVLPAVEEPFPITLSGLGIFPAARVLWAGVEPSAELRALAGRVRRALAEASVPFDPQGFNPHITLARKPAVPEGVLLPRIAVPRVTMTVREVCLYLSHREESGMAYMVIGETPQAKGLI
ncbi:MAG: RNA 2',3'-cyclic phosphodiesterase [Clostridia bacterium]|nr:RNA 2',3'-cyclic phosphodiesterase [Clostridia bacterium]